MSDPTTPLCAEIDDDIDAVVSGSAAPRLLEHLADCDRCRDARHAAERAIALARDAGIDYQHPSDFEARLESLLAERSAAPAVDGAEAAPTPASRVTATAAETQPATKFETQLATQPGAPRGTQLVTQPGTERDPLPVAAPSGPPSSLRAPRDTLALEGALPLLIEGPLLTEGMSPKSAARVAVESAGSDEAPAQTANPIGASVETDRPAHARPNVGRPVVRTAIVRLASSLRWVRRPRNTVATGLVAAALTAALVALVVRPPGVADSGSVASAPWSGKVGKISRAAGGEGGLEICGDAGCTPATPGAIVASGSRLVTDDRTRAYVELEDGTRLSLDRSTELQLDGGANRRARLHGGAIVADVAKSESNVARIDLPRGRVEVLGTKFALRTMGQAVSVDVSRGAVLLVDEGERSVKVRAGEEGRSYPGAAPYTSAAPRFGEALSFSDESGDEELAVRGLGELKAKKPGSDEERRDAVKLTAHKVKVRIVDGFARTEVDEVFSNESNEVLEGIYRFPLPPDAQIERLALEVDGKFEEGAFVDRDRAAAIWRGAIVSSGGKPRPREEIVWVPGPWKDPALLEWQRGGRFELRIFPIPAKGSRRVILTYTQVVKSVAGVRRYIYPLAHDPSGTLEVADFGVDVQVRGHDREQGVAAIGYKLDTSPSSGADALSFRAQRFVPSGDLALEYAVVDRKAELSAWGYEPVAKASPASSVGGSKAPAASTVQTLTPQKPPPATSSLRSGQPATAAPAPSDIDDARPYLALALRPKLPRRSDDAQRNFALVVDASRSMFGERYRRASALASRMVGELDRLDRFTVLACDTSCRVMAGGLQTPSYQAANEVEQFLNTVTPEGASDPAASVREAAAAVGEGEGRSLRVVYIGDGTPTVGPIRPADLTIAARDAVPASRGTVTAVAIGADADLDSLNALARGGSGVALPYVPGERIGEAAFAVLGASYGMGLSDVEIELPSGLADRAPRELDTIAPGSEVMVSARMESPDVKGTVVLRGKLGGKPFEQRYPLAVTATRDDAHAFVPRLYAAARIADLERDGTFEARQRAVALSSDFNVQSRFTSLLVLESPAMFRAFGLDNSRRTAEWTGEDDLSGATAEGESELAGDEDGEISGTGPGGGGRVGEKKAKGGALRSDPLATDAPWDDGDDKASERGNAAPMPSVVARPAPSPQPAPPPPSGRRPASEPSEPQRSAPAKKPMAGCPPGDLMCAMQASQGDSARERMSRDRRMVPMRRVFERRAEILFERTIPTTANSNTIAEAERELQGNENRRSSLTKLYRLLMQSGQLERARELAERWSEKEALDPEALTARADVAASMGRRDDAIRILGSVIDVRPGDVAAHQRLMRLHRLAGQEAVGCRHALAVAQLRQGDVPLLTEAVACGRQSGESALVERMLARASDTVRSQVDAALAQRKVDTTLRGDLRIEATWEGSGHDLDLALIHPAGHRVSWLGAPTKEIISAVDVTSSAGEGLALLGSQAGEYVIEIVRSRGEGPVRGTLKVQAGGAVRSIPFTLTGERVALGTVRVFFESRLVPW
jgi:hypothetical protein